MINLHAEFQDNGQEKTVILLHGFLNDRRSMAHIGSSLKQCANILSVDLPGFGESKSFGIDYTMGDVADALYTVQKKYDIEHTQTYMLGYSMGGRAALSYACRYPTTLSGLILESASPGIGDSAEKKERIEIDEKRALEMVQDYPAFIQSWENMGLFNSQTEMDEQVFNEQRQARLSQIPKEAADSLRKYGTGVQPSYWDRLKSVDIPVLQLVGSRDEKFISINQRMNDSFPDAVLNIVDGAGHNIHLEVPEKFDTIVSEFINRRI